MTDEQWYSVAASGVFLLFVIEIVAIVASQLYRIGRWVRSGRQGPLLLYRDVIGFGGLAGTITLIAFARVTNLPPDYLHTVPWLLFSSAPALVGLTVFNYFEFFVIGHGPD